MWITEADVILDFNKLSENDKAYRKSMKVHLPSKHEPSRQAARAKGVAYRVRIAGYNYRFECAEDAYIFEHVNVRACCSLDEFIVTVDAGVIWSSGDVEAWREQIASVENKTIESITIKQHVDMWLNSTVSDLCGMRSLIKHGQRPVGLFWGHLAVEKALKALCITHGIAFVKYEDHDLRKLADRIPLSTEITDEQFAELDEITKFYMAQESNDIVFITSFRKLCSSEFARHWEAKVMFWYNYFKSAALEQRGLLPDKTFVAVDCGVQDNEIGEDE